MIDYLNQETINYLLVLDYFDIGSIDLCVLCVFVVRSTPSLGEMYLRIHFTHQSWESQLIKPELGSIL